MSKFAIALAAAALLAAPSFSSTAEAGGIRLGFGFPLGSFVARPHQSYGGPSGYQQYCAKKEARQARIAAARQQEMAARKAQAQKMAAAERAAEIKRAKAAEAIQTAKVETKPVTTEAAPTVYVPVNTATTETTQVANTAATTTTTEPAKTAALEPVAEKAPVVEEAKTEKVEKSTVKVSATAKRVCRKFSAAIAGLIDVPCE